MALLQWISLFSGWLITSLIGYICIVNLTSGTVVMFIQWAPHEFHILLSALEENLGPSMVNMVPPLCTGKPSSLVVWYIYWNGRCCHFKNCFIFIMITTTWKLCNIVMQQMLSFYLFFHLYHILKTTWTIGKIALHISRWTSSVIKVYTTIINYHTSHDKLYYMWTLCVSTGFQ